MFLYKDDKKRLRLHFVYSSSECVFLLRKMSFHIQNEIAHFLSLSLFYKIQIHLSFIILHFAVTITSKWNGRQPYVTVYPIYICPYGYFLPSLAFEGIRWTVNSQISFLVHCCAYCRWHSTQVGESKVLFFILVEGEHKNPFRLLLFLG